jgi:RecB family exonuclease
MILPADFTFSQSNLQDYRDCPYRFYLRYILHTRWPALIVEDALKFEQRGQSGARFHRLVQQYLLGVPEDRLLALVANDPDPDLSEWWENFLAAIPPLLEGKRFVETTLATTLAGHRILAKYDLILTQPNGQLIIFDWKTSQKKPRKDWLEDRVQTRLYRFILASSGSILSEQGMVTPEQIEMRYWFAPNRTAPVTLPYDIDQFEQDGEYFNNLIEEIADKSADSFYRTADESRCRFCVYRAHCDRGAVAGELDEFEDEEPSDTGLDNLLDFDQISEIEF